MIPDVHIIKTRKYGTIMVTNQSETHDVYDEDGYLLCTFPAGLVIRWMSEGGEPAVMTVKDVFLKDFICDTDIRDYIDGHSILG